MNRVNPIYIAAFLFSILLFIIYQNHKIEEQISKKQQKIATLEQKAKEMATLKGYWGDRKVLKKRVEAILKTPFIAKFIKKRDNQREKIRVYLEKIDSLNADRIADKILNSFVKIGAVNIKKRDKNHIDMEVEFRF
jgi:hypothetical protein